LKNAGDAEGAEIQIPKQWPQRGTKNTKKIGLGFVHFRAFLWLKALGKSVSHDFAEHLWSGGTVKKSRCLPRLLLLWIGLGLRAETHAQTSARVSAWPRGVTYEIFVQSFADSNGDGIGDIKGMTSKLDYLKDLGVEGVWLMPINPSPTYHKYDVTDYYAIHPDYGTLEDFKEFVREAHKRSIRVVIDLVINHSSSRHPWFQAALQDPQSPYWNYYVWTHQDDPQVNVIDRTVTGDPISRRRWAKAGDGPYLYYRRFSAGMPDLNFDNARVREEIFKIGRFWLSDVGVDGFRLDAAKHIFPDERPKDNHWWWEYFRAEMRKAKENVYLVGEVWAPAEVVAPYTKGLTALFNFDLATAIKAAVNDGRGDALAAKQKQVIDLYASVSPDFVDATFLSNHDQNRVMSVFEGDLAKAKVAAAILLTLPGSPYLYYGEEIGMTGQKPDPNIREPFHWEKQASDKSRTRWMEPKHSTEAAIVPAAEQAKDPASLLNFYKRLIALRNASRALTFGAMQPVDFGRGEVCAFERSVAGESLLVLHNVSAAEISVGVSGRLKDYGQVAFTQGGAGMKPDGVFLPGRTTLILKK
jgi:alpha-amylase